MLLILMIYSCVYTVYHAMAHQAHRVERRIAMAINSDEAFSRNR